MATWARPVIDPTLTLQPDAANGVDMWMRDSTIPGEENKNWGINASLSILYRVAVGRDRSLIKFNVSSIPGVSIISSATLYLTYNNLRNATTLIKFHDVKAANGDWVEGTKSNATAGTGESCWKYKNYNTVSWAGGEGLTVSGIDYDSTEAGSFTIPSSGNDFEIALSPSVVKGWTTTNNGLLCKPEIETGDETKGVIVSSSDNETALARPKLVIVYSIPARRALLGVGR
jgi:hypothetical protein